MGLIILAVGAVGVLVQVALAAAVNADARQIRTDQLPLEIGPMLWFWTTLVGGIVAVGIYWFIYHSNLRSDRTEP